MKRDIDDSERVLGAEQKGRISATYLVAMPRGERQAYLKTWVTDEMEHRAGFGDALDLVTQVLVAYFGAVRAAVYALEDQRRRLRLVAFDGAACGRFHAVIGLDSRSPIAEALRSGGLTVVPDAPSALRELQRTTRSRVLVALTVANKPFGVLEMAYLEPCELLDVTELQLLGSFVNELLQRAFARCTGKPATKAQRVGAPGPSARPDRSLV